MEQIILEVLIRNGPWAALFLWALWDKSRLINRIMEENAKREERLITCLEGKIDNVSDEVSEVKNDIKELKGAIRMGLEH